MPTRSTYDQLKEFGGKRYTGMRVGRSHTWKYDAGSWKETKVTPDRWEFSYSVVKRRAGRAPEGSGAPVGTAYHWYIVADQVVTKLDANSYMTEMVGHKLKLSHRRADRSTWSATDRAQSTQLIKLLRSLADDLEARRDTEPNEHPTDADRRAQPASRTRADGGRVKSAVGANRDDGRHRATSTRTQHIHANQARPTHTRATHPRTTHPRTTHPRTTNARRTHARTTNARRTHARRTNALTTKRRTNARRTHARTTKRRTNPRTTTRRTTTRG